MSNVISNATVWVTGASSGIGKALVEQLVAHRNFVIVSARSTSSLKALESRYTGSVAVVPFDVTEWKSLPEIKLRLEAITDHIDILIMCAGTCEYDDGPELNMDLYKRVMDVNYFGVVNTVRVALPLLKRAAQVGSRKPKIVAISSLATLVPFPRAEAYGASKAAMEYLMHSLAVDLKPSKIDVAIIRPGFVDTPLTRKNDFDMPGLMSPTAAAQVILAKVKTNAFFVNFPWPLSFVLRLGRIFPSFWLNSVAPRLVRKGTL